MNRIRLHGSGKGEAALEGISIHDICDVISGERVCGAQEYLYVCFREACVHRAACVFEARAGGRISRCMTDGRCMFMAPRFESVCV